MKTPHPNNTDVLAARLAGNIIDMKRKTAAALNSRVNSLSRPGKIRLLTVIGLIIGASIVLCIQLPFRQFMANQQSYVPTHIGAPSELPVPKATKPVDSLNH